MYIECMYNMYIYIYIYTYNAYNVYAISDNIIHCLYIASTMYIYCVHIVYTLWIHCIYMAYTSSTHFGTIWGILGPPWDRFGHVLGSFRWHSGTVLESFWDRFGIVL